MLNFAKKCVFFFWRHVPKEEVLMHQGVETARCREAAYGKLSTGLPFLRCSSRAGGAERPRCSALQLVDAAVWISATSVPFLLILNGERRTKRRYALCIKLKLTQIASKMRSANCSRVIYRPRVTLQ